MLRKIAYWVSTGLLCLLYISSAYMYATKSEHVRDLLMQLGYPAYLQVVLLCAKPLAIAAILSRVSVKLSDLAYAGMFYHLLLAGLAHLLAAEYGYSVPAFLAVGLVIVSFRTQNAARRNPSLYAPPADAGTASGSGVAHT